MGSFIISGGTRKLGERLGVIVFKLLAAGHAGSCSPLTTHHTDIPVRDDYDKEVKQAKEKQRKRYTPGPSRPRKPDLQVYHPRPRERPSRTTDRADDDLSDTDSSTDPETSANQLFCLEFEADGGEVTSLVVYEVISTAH
ncbi:UPF0561 protein C2orf68 homolog isoform X3 [Phyllobates terribilis]|uniref:UPF0561 protein C2orf68 homolog isoform X3 n=1 Tax=Phyllobates terribilis TaxID=111132 RepID=UPI003CCB2586